MATITQSLERSVRSVDDTVFPAPGSPAELQRFAELQQRLPGIFRRLFPDPGAPQTILVVPSMSLDEEELPKLTGACRYEERLLCLLMLLRRPGIRIVHVSSSRLSPAIIDYYLNMLPGVAPAEARRRLVLLDCDDDSPAPLTRKILARPWLLDRIAAALRDPASAHMTCFNTTALERTLAVRLGIPLYGCDPQLLHLGSKSGSRSVFRRAGVALPAGYEKLRDMGDVAEALSFLKRQDPQLRRAIVKLNDGFSGEGNALFAFAGAPSGPSLLPWIEAQLPTRLRFVAPAETFDPFREKFGRMGGVVEAFVEGEQPRSPSVQCRIDPLGTGRVISTHDQVLGGQGGQVFLGCTFPASPEYAAGLHDAGLRVTDVLQQEGVLGRFAVDFISHRRNGRWQHTALEINLRKGGTTHPYLMLQFLTGGDYSAASGEYRTASGRPRCYAASDNLGGAAYRGATPAELIDLAVSSGLQFDNTMERGVMFHLLGALPDHGKLGAVCVGETQEEAARLYTSMVQTLSHHFENRLAARSAPPAAHVTRRASRGPLLQEV